MLLRKATDMQPERMYFALNPDNSYSRIKNASDRMLNSTLLELDEFQVSDTTLAHVGTLDKDDFVICGDFLGYLQQRPLKLLDGKYLIIAETGVMKLSGTYVEVVNTLVDDEDVEEEVEVEADEREIEDAA